MVTGDGAVKALAPNLGFQ